MIAQLLVIVIVIALAAAEPAVAQVIGKSKQAEGRGAGQGVPLLVGSGIEFQSDGQSWEAEYPVVLEYGVSDDLKLNLEWSYITIHSKSKPDVQSDRGSGDLETFIEYGFLPEAGYRPALTGVAGIKWPLSNDPDLSTGEIDYTVGLIASEELADWSVDIGASYTFLGSPPDARLGNVFELSLALERPLYRFIDVEGEFLYSRGGGARATSQSGAGGVLGSELTGGNGSPYQFTIGFAEHVNDYLKLEQGVVLEPDGSWQAVVFWELDFSGGR